MVGDRRDEERQKPIAERLDRGAPAAAPRGYEGRGEPDRARREPDTFVVPGKAAFGCGGQRAIERCRADAGGGNERGAQIGGDVPDEAMICLRRKIGPRERSEEHTSELQSLMRISYAVFCLKKKNDKAITTNTNRKIPQKI